MHQPSEPGDRHPEWVRGHRPCSIARSNFPHLTGRQDSSLKTPWTSFPVLSPRNGVDGSWRKRVPWLALSPPAGLRGLHSRGRVSLRTVSQVCNHTPSPVRVAKRFFLGCVNPAVICRAFYKGREGSRLWSLNSAEPGCPRCNRHLFIAAHKLRNETSRGLGVITLLGLDLESLSADSGLRTGHSSSEDGKERNGKERPRNAHWSLGSYLLTFLPVSFYSSLKSATCSHVKSCVRFPSRSKRPARKIIHIHRVRSDGDNPQGLGALHPELKCFRRSGLWARLSPGTPLMAYAYRAIFQIPLFCSNK